MTSAKKRGTSSTPNLFATPTETGSKKSATKETPPPEYNVLFVGTHHKEPLFEKMLCVAERYERHMQYQDTCYLYFNYTQQGPLVVELNDPGIEHTGAREMAIRKAHAVIMCYAAHNPASFHQLATLADDFKPRKSGVYPPVILICNEDENLAEREKNGEEASELAEEDILPTQFPTTEEAICPLSTPSTIAPPSSQPSSTSEGYESQQDPEEDSDQHHHQSHQSVDGAGDDDASTARMNSPTSSQRLRRASMEVVREQFDDGSGPISREQGETLARLFGPDCQFHPVRFADYSHEDVGSLMESLLERIIAHVAMNGAPNTTGRNERKPRKKSKSPPSSGGNGLLKEIKRRGSFIPIPPFFKHNNEPSSPKEKDEVSANKKSPCAGPTLLKSVYSSSKSNSKSPKQNSKSGDSSKNTSCGGKSSEDGENKGGRGGLRKLSTVFSRRRAKSQNPPSLNKVSDSGGVPSTVIGGGVEEVSSPQSTQSTATTPRVVPATPTVVEMGVDLGGGDATPPISQSRKHSFRVACHAINPDGRDSDVDAQTKATASSGSSQARSHVCVIS